MAVRRERGAAGRQGSEPLIGAKDSKAFEVLYDRHAAAAFSLAYRIVGDRAAAEEVTQEAFISADAQEDGAGRSDRVEQTRRQRRAALDRDDRPEHQERRASGPRVG